MSAQSPARRRLLVALAGAEDPSLVERLALVAGAGGGSVEIELLHVIDSGPRGLARRGPELRARPWPRPAVAGMDQRLSEAEEEGAGAILAAWSERFAAGLPGAAIETAIRRGEPEHEIIAAALECRADAVVLCARPRTGATEPGPRSLGHVARFVVDHAPVPVLLVRHSG